MLLLGFTQVCGLQCSWCKPELSKNWRKMAAERQSGQQVFSKGAYVLGKMVWAKGYRELIDLLAKHKSDLDDFNMDVFGNGEYAHEVQTIAWTLNLNVNFMKGRDHANDSFHRYEPFS
ncbi:digalactosyldiacylglycerol synthase 1, chloroplastic-like [Capsicum annuum]|uniref:digalactosyldiacylglycerol synthase 1, chloroplastic-like n=1 Tax=Capsicum annuum TaxID=4072 RepID=UPI001FB1125B|nr:digalactosyldiacylglycerol synthase 1, chloroplastic-like [Capsicum annuum]